MRMLAVAGLRRSRRLRAAAFLALVAELMLVTLSPMADARYHETGPVQLRPSGGHHVSGGFTECPECIALQQVAMPGTPVQTPRTSLRPLEVVVCERHPVYYVAVFTPKSPRAPPFIHHPIHRV
jgi:hypothetical protein